VRTRLVVRACARVRVGHDPDVSAAVVRQATDAQLRRQTLFVLVHDDAVTHAVQYIEYNIINILCDFNDDIIAVINSLLFLHDYYTVR